MISVLIPTYNYNVFPLVENLSKQCDKERIEYEIIVIDDCSDKLFENEKINSLVHCCFSRLTKNIGRSAIRNLLAEQAKFDWLLFLDADAFPLSNNFIYNYVKEFNYSAEVLCGGMRYEAEKPSDDKIFRWKYGNNREALTAIQRSENKYLNFFTINFAIRKSVFNQVRFNEKLLSYGYEDLLFSYNLKQENIQIKHIENPVYHNGIESNDFFLRKTEQALVNLNFLLNEKIIPKDYIKLTKYLNIIEKTKTKKVVALFFKLTKPSLQKQILSTNPNLLAFDLYRLGYICSLKS